MVLSNVNIVLEDKTVKGSLSFENGVFTSLCSKGDGKDMKGLYIAPGIVDLHVHGSGGHDFMDGEAFDILTAAKSLAMTGTTTCLATSLTSTDEELLKFLSDTEEVMGNIPEDCAHIEGVHLEGPFFSPEKKGAQSPEFLKEPIPENYSKILDKYGTIIKRWSVAPELKGAFEFIKTISEEGIIASGAHTNADYDIISQAYDCGMSLLTHFFNAMTGTIKDGVRGAVDAGLEIPQLGIEMICDGIHIPEDKLNFFLKTKNHNYINACSDSMRGAGMPDGESVLGPLKHGTPVIIEDGVAKLTDRSHFAGSVATGMRLVQTLHNIAGLPFEDVFRITSLNPASMIGIGNKTGSVSIGKNADFIVFDEELNLKEVYVMGKRIR